jgi:hypothetical protein
VSPKGEFIKWKPELELEADPDAEPGPGWGNTMEELEQGISSENQGIERDLKESRKEERRVG